MSLDQEALSSLRLDRNSAAPGSRPSLWRRYRWYLIAAAVVLLLLLFMGRGGVVVETATAEAPLGSGRPAVLNASGYVEARRIATVASKVTGQVIEVLVEEGATVTEGQVLARLDTETARAAYDVAARQRDAAERNLAEIEVRLAEARRTLKRTTSLREQSLVAQSALDTAAADVSALAARLAASRGELAVSASALKQQQQYLDDLVVRAPFGGVVISKDAQPGEMVSPISAGGGFTRTGIATIVDMDSREIEVDVNEAFINRVKPGQSAEATLDAYPDWTIPARVINIVPAADRQKATVRVRIAFEHLDPRILPDMGIKVRFLDDSVDANAPKPVAMVPVAAVAREGAETAVWVVKDGRTERRAVRVGKEQGEQLGVFEGLKPGEVVVAKLVEGLKQGGRVTVKAG